MASIKLATCVTSPPRGRSAALYSGGKPSPAKPWQLAQPLLYMSLPVVPVMAPVELLLEELLVELLLVELLLEDEDEVLVDVLLDDELELVLEEPPIEPVEAVRVTRSILAPSSRLLIRSV